MWHHDPLVAKPLQDRMVWKREVVMKIVIDLFLNFLFKCTHACCYTRSHMRTRAHDRTNKKNTSQEIMMVCERLSAGTRARQRACDVVKHVVVAL